MIVQEKHTMELLTGLSEIGLVEQGNVPCPCFHENTEILCFDPDSNKEFYKKRIKILFRIKII